MSTSNINRDQIAKAFGGDPRLIRQFEMMAQQTTATPGQLLDVALAADAANSKAAAALGAAARLERDVDLAGSDAVAALARANAAIGKTQTIADDIAPIKVAPAQRQQSSAVDYIDFRPSAPATNLLTGRASWNEDDGTLEVGLLGGSALQIGQETMYYAKNTSGALIPNGTPCMFTGTVGASGKLTFGLAVADGSVTAEYMMGVATQDIDNNAFGYITTFGLVRGFNTSGAPYGETWTDGDILYFDPAAPGSWTNALPVAPAIKAPAGIVINAATGGSGSIFVRMRTDVKITELYDVHAPAPANGHVLIYDAVQNRWESATITAGSNITITNSAGGITIAAASTAGASGSFLSADAKTITVVDGLITSIV